MDRRVVGLLALMMMTGAMALPSSDGWSQFRVDNEHSAVADDAIGILAATDRFVTTPGPILGGIATADVDGERITFYGTYTGINQPGTLHATRPDGSDLWTRTQSLPAPGGYIATPALRDLDGDGNLELIAATLDDSTIRVHDARDGSVLCSVTVGTVGRDLLASSAMVADLHATPGLEFVVGGSKGDEAGSLMVYDKDCNELWSAELDGPAWSSALIQDLDGDGAPEVTIATGLPETIEILFPNAKSGGQSVYVFEADGTLQCSHQMNAASMGSPVAADIDGDGATEIVVADTYSQTRVLRDDCTLQRTLSMSGIGTPVLNDIDGDGHIEIIYGDWTSVRSWEVTTTGATQDHRVSLEWKHDVDPWVLSSIALGDLDNDGDLDVVAATTPVAVNLEQPLESDALPGTVYGIDLANNAVLWEYELPDDGAISSPAIDDLDGDGWAEVIIGEGVPLIGDGGALHVIENANPIIRGVSSPTASPMATKPVAFRANVIDGDQATASLSYSWDFGDGNTSNDHAPTHAFDAAGAHTVTLTVSDGTHTWTRGLTVSLREHRELAASSTGVPDDADLTPGAPLTFTGAITNAGSVTDTFRFSSGYDALWGFTLPSDLTLAPGETAAVSLAATVPAGGPTPVVNVQVVSLGDGTITDSLVWGLGGSLQFLVGLDGAYSRDYIDPVGNREDVHDSNITGHAYLGRGQLGIPGHPVTVTREQESSDSALLDVVLAGGPTVLTGNTSDAGFLEFAFSDDASRAPGRHRVTIETVIDGVTYTNRAYYEVRAPAILQGL